MIVEAETELTELETAERVLLRLTGAKRPETGAADQRPTPAVSGATEEPPLTEKIFTVLQEAHRRGLRGLEPSGIYEAIVEKGWSATKDNVRTTAWRLWREDRLSKGADSPLYGILLPATEKPETNTTADSISPAGEQSAVVDQPEQQGREAGPGGGT